MTLTNRRRFLRDAAWTSFGAAAWPGLSAAGREDAVSFFLVGDTHYCAQKENFKVMDEVSASYNAALVRHLNELPGTAFPEGIGGGLVPVPSGVIHAGDIVDNGDKGPGKHAMAETEFLAFTTDWGLNGDDGKLRWPVREVHGNHDSPRGDGPVITGIKERNQRRAGTVNRSANGLHYSWDWGGVHFVALGIVVGDAPEVTRKRRYAPLGSLLFLKQDLETHVGKSGRPIVLVHHVDVHRYSETVPDEKVKNSEWDYGDAQAFHAALWPYRVAATMCGHTHTRKIVRWNGTKDDRATEGVPFLNTDNAAHFHNTAQAILHVEIAAQEMRVREFGTKDGWQTGAWTQQVWRFPLAV
ncbi:MAG: metallophosphoesterase [Prosthecobacter sp.]